MDAVSTVAAIALEDLIDDSEMALPRAPGRRASARAAGPSVAAEPLLLAPETTADPV